MLCIMRFVKMHGIGNDYVYVDGFYQQVPDPQRLAVAVADRHFGVGADGLILVLPPSEGIDAHVRMRMFNADGSEGEMCGNGVRCVAKFAYDRNLARANPMRVETGRGVLSLDLHLVGGRVTVDMDEPILAGRRIPTTYDTDQVVNVPLAEAWLLADMPWFEAAGMQKQMTCVSMGNPHVIVFCDDVAKVPLEQAGPAMEHAPQFPNRINVHVVQVVSRSELKMRTWERGSGITLACGTGACAVAVAGVLAGRSDRNVLVRLPGGDLEIAWRDDNHVLMTGPATEVFSGDWPGPSADA